MRFLSKSHYLNKLTMRILTKALNLPDPYQCHIKLWKKMKTSISIWIVDGRIIRQIFEKGFLGGGHDYKYEFISLNEIWIDDTAEENDRLFIFLHELHVRNLMAQGWSSDEAHNGSILIENHCRQFPAYLQSALTKENW